MHACKFEKIPDTLTLPNMGDSVTLGSHTIFDYSLKKKMQTCAILNDIIPFAMIQAIDTSTLT